MLYCRDNEHIIGRLELKEQTHLSGYLRMFAMVSYDCAEIVNGKRVKDTSEIDFSKFLEHDERGRIAKLSMGVEYGKDCKTLVKVERANLFYFDADYFERRFTTPDEHLRGTRRVDSEKFFIVVNRCIRWSSVRVSEERMRRETACQLYNG